MNSQRNDARPGMLSMDQLRAAAAAGEIHTVVLAMVDMQGRLVGKRLGVRHFLDQVAEHHAEGCSYLLTVDVDVNPVQGYRMSSWETGYGDFVYVPDLSSLRRLPWMEGSAWVVCDLQWADGQPVVASPRQILRRQIERLAAHGLEAFTATELEFIVFRDTYEQAWHKGYRDLRPANWYNVDYALLDTARLEPLLARIRNSMDQAGIRVENSKGECNFGQYEINFSYGRALEVADQHALYKHGAKEIAAQEGCSLTYMAKYNQREGNSCHVHMSVRDLEGRAVTATPNGQAPSVLFARFIAGQLACMRELTLLLAPNIIVQALREGQLRPHRHRLGSRQPHLRRAHRRPRPVAAAGKPRAGRRRQCASGAFGHARRGHPRHRARTGTGAAAAGQCLHLVQAARAALPERGGGAVRQLEDGTQRLRRRGGRALPADGAGRDRRVRSHRHRLGTVALLRAHVARSRRWTN